MLWLPDGHGEALIITFVVIVFNVLVKNFIKGKFAPEGGQMWTPGTPAVPPLS